jgi:hypothetical protein
MRMNLHATAAIENVVYKEHKDDKQHKQISKRNITKENLTKAKIIEKKKSKPAM